jgi:hypothetical protein
MTDDKMPPLPAYVYGRETAANERLIPLGDAEAWRNAARAYAAEQVRELVEGLQSAVDAWSGDGPPVVLDTLRALIAKHKGAP